MNKLILVAVLLLITNSCGRKTKSQAAGINDQRVPSGWDGGNDFDGALKVKRSGI